MAVFELDCMKTEKAKAMFKFNMLKFIWNIFRIIELALVIIFLHWSSSRLPFAIRISGEYFRRLVTVIISPIFVFLISNVIVFTLVFKTGQNSTVNNVETDLYDEIVMESENYQLTGELEEIIYQDKQVIMEAKVEDSVEEKVEVSDKMPFKVVESKHYGRSQSEKMIGKTTCEKFRRSETMKTVDSDRLSLVDEDELSNEEFQRRIELFIARQVKFHLEEKSAIVMSS
ncbi:uncharacterized protein LOC124916707 [Impatiens glandulifera]|uniref:uncharacterized protein LOC124916707 n=1 Tax=Impatiens glandulifera TaxID=253017 RepID=UPI001FB06685|nr:uncharacterized protein LOC124916707 [Impatiens glandulifera]